MGFFQDLFGEGKAKAAQESAAEISRGYGQAGETLANYYGQANEAIQSGYGQAQDVWRPTYNLGQAGAGLYGDITGVGGREGQDRARALYMTDPGYMFALNEALRATERTRGTGGFQNSGNVLAALTDRASGLALQDYGNWVNRLQPFLNYSLVGSGGLSGTYTGEAGALSGNLTGLGQGIANTNIGSANAIAAGIQGAADARAQGAKNITDLGTKLLGFALAPVTGGGSLASSLFNTPLTNPNMRWT